MKRDQGAPESVEAYIAGFKPEVRAVLRKMRATIRKTAPDAEERISWGMPAYALDGMLTFFAAFKNHVSLFPGPSGLERFRKELTAYETSKGTVRFSLGAPVPYGLIARIVKFRVKENRARAEARFEKRPSFRSRIARAQTDSPSHGGIEAGALIKKIERRRSRRPG